MSITDLTTREVVIFAPLILGTLVLGVQPNLIFDVTQASVDHLAQMYHSGLAPAVLGGAQ
jgi:NADH-quinone oxidoreductase subunit M